MEPIVTTIIPTYKRPNMLRRAIESALNQTFRNIRILVLDNASNDETYDTVQKLAEKDSRVKYICHSQNIGAFNNFQFGLKLVDTSFFSILSDDDLILPDFYNTALEGFYQNPDACFFVTGVIHATPEGNILGMPMLTKWKSGYFQPPTGLITMLDCGHPEWTGVLFRKEIIRRIGFLDEEVGAAIDLDYLLRAAASTPYIVSLKPGAIYIVRPVSKNINIYPFKLFWPGLLNMISNLTRDTLLPINIKIYAANIISNTFKKQLFKLGLRYIYQNQFDDALDIANCLSDFYGQIIRARILKHLISIKDILALKAICKSMDFMGEIWLFRNKILHTKLQKNIKLFEEYEICLKIHE